MVLQCETIHSRNNIYQKYDQKNLQEEIVDISIQSEPCMDNMCRQCILECTYRKVSFENFNQWDRESVTGKNQFVNS